MKYVLFGASKSGREALEYYGDEVVYFVDNFKKEKEFCGKKVLSLDEYMELPERPHIIITSHKHAVIKKQLLEREITDFEIFFKLYEHSDVPIMRVMTSDNWVNEARRLFNREGCEILEVGSRVVTGQKHRNLCERANYTGFDLYEGENVDVAGDAHRLSEYFDKKFDFIFSLVVFEHLAMPWVVAEEMIKLLKPGGYIYVATHYAFSSHERPWHFFQFSEQALKCLFPKAAGIECIEAGCADPIKGEFSENSHPTLRGGIVPGLYTFSMFFGKKVKEVENFDWRNVNYYETLGMYPPKKD